MRPFTEAPDLPRGTGALDSGRDRHLAATDWTSGERPTTPFLNCPRCGLSIALRPRWLANPHCPRCLGRNSTIVELFSSGLPADALYHDNSLPRADLGHEQPPGPR